jgi:hypothetical protein
MNLSNAEYTTFCIDERYDVDERQTILCWRTINRMSRQLLMELMKSRHMLCRGCAGKIEKVQRNIVACYNGVCPLRLACSHLRMKQSLDHRFYRRG